MGPIVPPADGLAIEELLLFLSAAALAYSLVELIRAAGPRTLAGPASAPPARRPARGSRLGPLFAMAGAGAGLAWVVGSSIAGGWTPFGGVLTSGIAGFLGVAAIVALGVRADRLVQKRLPASEWVEDASRRNRLRFRVATAVAMATPALATLAFVVAYSSTGGGAWGLLAAWVPSIWAVVASGVARSRFGDPGTRAVNSGTLAQPLELFAVMLGAMTVPAVLPFFDSGLAVLLPLPQLLPAGFLVLSIFGVAAMAGAVRSGAPDPAPSQAGRGVVAAVEVVLLAAALDVAWRLDFNLAWFGVVALGAVFSLAVSAGGLTPMGAGPPGRPRGIAPAAGWVVGGALVALGSFALGGWSGGWVTPQFDASLGWFGLALSATGFAAVGPSALLLSLAEGWRHAEGVRADGGPDDREPRSSADSVESGSTRAAEGWASYFAGAVLLVALGTFAAVVPHAAVVMGIRPAAFLSGSPWDDVEFGAGIVIGTVSGVGLAWGSTRYRPGSGPIESTDRRLAMPVIIASIVAPSFGALIAGPSALPGAILGVILGVAGTSLASRPKRGTSDSCSVDRATFPWGLALLTTAFALVVGLMAY